VPTIGASQITQYSINRLLDVRSIIVRAPLPIPPLHDQSIVHQGSSLETAFA
jgi:hypothetical protein